MTAKTYPDSTSAEYTYDLVGKISQVSDPTGTYAFAYDNMGRLIGTTTTYSFLTTPFTNSYSYDANSNRTGFTAPDSSTNTYTYDTLNRLTTLANSWAGSFGFSYDAMSRRTQMRRPNGIATNYAYDKLSHLLSVLHQAGASTIDGEAYTVDAAGNRTVKTDYLASATSNYTYDKIYELTQVMQGANTTESYSYDPVGNRLSSLGVSSYTNNTSNELTSTSTTSYAYDANGNTLTKTDSTGTTNYAWDFENRLTQVTLPGTGGTVQFRYDPFGRRIEKVFTQGTNTTTTNYLYDSVDSIEEIDQSGNVFAKYARTTNIDELLAESRSGATSFYEADGLGSVTSLTSGAGALAQTYTYDSFGKVVTSSGNATNAFRYAGREFDTETNLYYYRARYYDPTIARFLSEDPVRFGAGINFYAYVKNEPIDFVDPYGLKCEQLTPWKEVPRMTSPNALKPYSTVQGGLFWVPGTWDFVGGDGSSSCICEWVATHVRKRKLYRERIEEQAWFQCTDSCGKPEPAKVQTRTGTRHWETDEPGWPLWSPQTTYVSGPTVQLSGSSHPGGDPNKFNTQCLACSLVYRP